MSDNTIVTNNATNDAAVNTYNTLNAGHQAAIVGAKPSVNTGDTVLDSGINKQTEALTMEMTEASVHETYEALLARLQASVTSLEHKTNLEQVHLFEIDLNTRSISAPPEFQDFIGVVGEHKSETLTFRCNRYFNTVDLARMMIIVEYVNADGQGRISPIVMRDYKENQILFDWVVDSGMTGSAGIVYFDVRFYMTGPELEDGGHKLVYSLRTLPYVSRVVDTLPLDMQRFELEYKDQFATELEALLSATLRLQEQVAGIHVYWNDLT